MYLISANDSDKNGPLIDLFIDYVPMRYYEMTNIESGHKYRYFTPSYGFLVTDYVFLVSRSAPYSFFEKALMPFDAAVWYWLIVFVAFGLMVIVVVSFMSQKVRNFVFGSNVRAAMLNLV
jgi:hypothetical protein